MLKVGSKFYTFDELSKRLEEFQQVERVQLWVRDSRTVVAAAKRARRKSLNPALKYAELTYSCVFGGRRPSDLSKTHNQTSAGGCPFKVRLSTSNDGQALVVKEICHDHNHEPGKKLHEEPRRLYKNRSNTKTPRKPVRYVVNKQETNSVNSTPSLTLKSRVIPTTETVSLRLAQSPFQHLQVHKLKQQRITLQLEHLRQQRIEEEQQQQQLEKSLVLDSPEHSDSSDTNSTSIHPIGSIITSTEQYSYLPPSPISPSSSLSSGSRTTYSSDEEETVEPILDLDVALEEALGDLDSVSSLDLEDKFTLSGPNHSNRPLSHSLSAMKSRHADSEPSLLALPEPSSPLVTECPLEGVDGPPAKRLKGRTRRRSFSGSVCATELDIPDFGFTINDLMDFDVTLF